MRLLILLFLHAGIVAPFAARLFVVRLMKMRISRLPRRAQVFLFLFHLPVMVRPMVVAEILRWAVAMHLTAQVLWVQH